MSSQTLPTAAARGYADSVVGVLVEHGITRPGSMWEDIARHDVAFHYDAPGFLELVVDGSAREWRLHPDSHDERRVTLADHAPHVPRDTAGTSGRLALQARVNTALGCIPTSPSPVPAGGGGEVLGEEARAEYEAAEIHLRTELDDDEALSAVQLIEQVGWLPPRIVRALVAQARADGAAEERERLLRIYHREPMSQDCREGRHFGECWGCDCICHGPGGSS